MGSTAAAERIEHPQCQVEASEPPFVSGRTACHMISHDTSIVADIIIAHLMAVVHSAFNSSGNSTGNSSSGSEPVMSETPSC